MPGSIMLDTIVRDPNGRPEGGYKSRTEAAGGKLRGMLQLRSNSFPFVFFQHHRSILCIIMLSGFLPVLECLYFSDTTAGAGKGQPQGCKSLEGGGVTTTLFPSFSSVLLLLRYSLAVRHVAGFYFDGNNNGFPKRLISQFNSIQLIDFPFRAEFGGGVLWHGIVPGKPLPPPPCRRVV